MKKLVLTADTVGPVARGHPWVYRGGARGGAGVGELVELLDPRGRRVAFGLVDEGEIAVRVLGRDPVPLEQLVRERIQAAAALRRRVVPADTDAFRLLNGEGDGLPGLVVDLYGPLAVLRVYSAAWEVHLDPVVAALARLEPVRTVYRRLGVERVDGGRGGRTLHGPPAPEVLEVREHGLRFIVRPERGQKTGLFLDQRENRRWVGSIARGAEVVNLFGYSGGFSVYAAAGGARRTVTVDVAADALDDARENFRRNGFDPGSHGFAAADAFTWRPDRPAEVVVCDPPSLSRDAASDGAARRAYRELNGHAATMVVPGGILATASCTARIREDRWLEAVTRGLARVPGRWSRVHRAAEPPDHPVAEGHPEGAYLKLSAFWRRP